MTNKYNLHMLLLTKLSTERIFKISEQNALFRTRMDAKIRLLPPAMAFLASDLAE